MINHRESHDGEDLVECEHVCKTRTSASGVITVPNVSIMVLATVNAPYGTNLTATELAAKVCDPASPAAFDASAFSFFSDVDVGLQKDFIEEMELDPAVVTRIAQAFAELAGFDLPLAKSLASDKPSSPRPR